MVKKMELASKDEVSSVRMADKLFALHGLAVIKVHDLLVERGQNIKIGAIAKQDEHLRFTNKSLLLAYFLSFGRQGVSVMRKALASFFEMDSKDINEEVDKIFYELLDKLGIKEEEDDTAK